MLGTIYDDGSVKSLCEKCTTPCCTDQLSPLTFDYELLQISKAINKPVSEFSETIQINGKSHRVLKSKKNSNDCIFFDSKTQLCSIYENRPLDCKFFPFDIAKINGKYVWIILTCKGQKDSNWNWTEKNLDDFESDERFKYVVKDIDNYSRNDQIMNFSSNAELQSTDFVVLREVKIK